MAVITCFMANSWPVERSRTKETTPKAPRRHQRLDCVRLGDRPGEQGNTVSYCLEFDEGTDIDLPAPLPQVRGLVLGRTHQGMGRRAWRVPRASGTE